MNVFDLIIRDGTRVSIEEVFLTPDSRAKVVQLIREYRFSSEIAAHGLPLNNKVLLQGASGCGKTTTAKAIAHALGKPLYILNLSNVVSARIGETSQHLKQLFDKASRDKAVLFLDEFDQIGKERGNDTTDVGEMRRLVNTVIQLMDYLPQEALLIAATNHAEILDPALVRRFQLRVQFELPDDATLDEYYTCITAPFHEDLRNISRRYGISFAEARDEAFTQMKANLLTRLENEQRNGTDHTA